MHNKYAYAYVKDHLHYPLPGILTLDKWSKNVNQKNTLVKYVITIMDGIVSVK